MSDVQKIATKASNNPAETMKLMLELERRARTQEEIIPRERVLVLSKIWTLQDTMPSLHVN